VTSGLFVIVALYADHCDRTQATLPCIHLYRQPRVFRSPSLLFSSAPDFLIFAGLACLLPAAVFPKSQLSPSWILSSASARLRR
jgi:hypothetical protein